MIHPRRLVENLPTSIRVEVRGRGVVEVWDTGGTKTDPVLLLLHGWNVDAPTNFGAALAALEGPYRVVTFDLQGHGTGIRSGAPFRFEHCVTDALSVMDQLGIGRFTVVGYSMGGAIAQLLARRAPDRCAGLVLIASAQEFNSSSVERFQFAVLEVAVRALRRLPDAARHSMFRRIAKIACRPYPRWVLDAVLRSDPVSLLEAGTELGRFNSAEWASELSVPTTVVVTARDSVVGPERQEALAAGIPGARTVRIDAEHDLPIIPGSTLGESLLAAADTVTRQTPRVPPARRLEVLH